MNYICAFAQFFILCAFLSVTSILGASQVGAPPVALVVLTRVGTAPDELSSIVEITKVEMESAVALRVQLPNGQPLTIPKSEVGHLFWYPDVGSILSRPADVTVLSSKRAEAASLAKRFPKAKAICERVISAIDTDLQRLADGQIRVRGVWQSSPSTTSGPTSTTPSDLATLNVDGSNYKNIVITRLENGRLILRHDGGVARIPLTEASSELLRALRSKPSLFENAAPVAELLLENTRLTGVRVAAKQEKNVILLHDTGVLSIPQNTLSAAQQRALSIESEEPKSVASSSQFKKANPSLGEETRPPRIIEIGDASAPSIPRAATEAVALGMSLAQYEQIRKVALILGADYLQREKGTALDKANSACAVLITHAIRMGSAALASNQKMRLHDALIPSITLQESVNDALNDMLAAAEHNPKAVAAVFAARQKDIITVQGAEYQMAEMMATMSLRFERQDRLGSQAEASGFCRALEESRETAATKLQKFFGTIDADVQQAIIAALMGGDKNPEANISALLKTALNGQEELALTRNELDMTPEQYAAALVTDNQRVMKSTKGQRTLGHELLQFRRDQLKSAGAASFSNTSELDRINSKARNSPSSKN